MLMGSGVPKLFGQTKIYYVHQVSFFPQSHQEIVRFDVPMDEISGVDEFDTRYQLISQK